MGRQISRKKLILCLAGAAITGLWGGYALLHYNDDQRSVNWLQRHFEMVDPQLGTLKSLLQRYKQVHGRYPSNDEGLAALDNFDSRVSLSLNSEPRGHHDRFGFLGYSFWNRATLELKRFIETNKRPPRDLEDLEYLPSFTGYGLDQEQPKYLVEIAFADETFFVVDSAAVYSPWLEPYVYENRQGLPAKLFAKSIASANDSHGSIKIDRDVYVYSPQAMSCARQAEHRVAWQNVRLVLAILSLATCAVLIILAARAVVTIVAVLLIGAGLGGGVVTETMCYVMAQLFSIRDEKATAAQIELLDKYRANGVLSEPAYQKARMAIKDGPGTTVAQTQATTAATQDSD